MIFAYNAVCTLYQIIIILTYRDESPYYAYYCNIEIFDIICYFRFGLIIIKYYIFIIKYMCFFLYYKNNLISNLVFIKCSMYTHKYDEII